ncbi:MAG: DUF92 domain-containing protein [Planctomycetes bacterium]|nr:DUF92 domain-containing protein [Planctomycetota bacterium]
MTGSLLLGLAVNAAAAGAAFALRTVSGTGVLAGVALGTLIWWALDWRGWAILASFFALGSAFSRVGWSRKAAAGLAEANEGRRGAARALAKVAFPALAAIAHAIDPRPFLPVVFLAAFATALADTAGSEIGQVYGRRPVTLPAFRPAKVGAEGAVSLEGTLAGIAASILLAALGWALALVPDLGAHAIWIVGAAAFAGTTIESLVGSTLEGKGKVGKDFTNAMNTVVGGATGGALAALWMR